jgi:AcrR family transcriptional regulator
MGPSTGPESGFIPVSVVGRSEGRRRADAQRNRDRVFAAARRLVDTKGVAAVTMDDVAAAAGVGKGTVYRAFRSRAGLAEALLDDAERALQERMLSGPPPLGPGRDPAARLAAFVSAYSGFLEQNAPLLIETEKGTVGARFHTGAYAFWHWHVTHLLTDIGHPRPHILAHGVLGALAADLYSHLRHGVHTPPGRIRAALRQLVGGLADVTK